MDYALIVKTLCHVLEEGLKPTTLPTNNNIRERVFNCMFDEFGWDATTIEKDCDKIMDAIFNNER